VPAVAPKEEARRVLKVNDYLTDGESLVLVIQVDENGMLVEDARTERPFRLPYAEADGWERVPLVEIA
jgi:hypothetical protein